MRNLINPFIKITVLAFYLVGCTAMAVAPPAETSDSKKKTAEETPEMVAEAKAKVFSRSDVSVANGEKRFNQTCVYCHGHQGSGGKARKLQGRDLDPDYLFKTITRGKKRGSLILPPWKRSFNAEQRWELVTYILTLSEMK
jgi:mono/diheme cytochrome c family protein